MPVKLTQEEFINKSKSIYGELYDYSLVKFINSTTKVDIICKTHGIFSSTPKAHLRGVGCVYCSGAQTHLLESVYTKMPNLVKYFFNEEDSKTHSPMSGKKIKFICPTCGETKMSHMYNVSNRGFICNTCSIGTSVPEKFFIGILRELKIEYKHQYRPLWSEGKIYDFYLPKFNKIIEVHGGYHYVTCRYSNSKDVKLNDEFKKKIAMSNNTNSYYEINCSKSTFEFLKSNILRIFTEAKNIPDSRLYEIWCECYNLETKLVLDAWNSGIKTPKEIGKVVNLSEDKSRKYLNMLSRLNLCNYNGKENKKLGGKASSKKVYQYDLSLNLIKEYNSCRIAGEEVGLTPSCIISNALGITKTSGGFFWSYNKIDDENSKLEYIEKIKNKKTTKVYQYHKDLTYICSYESVTEASKALGVSSPSIFAVLSGKASSTKDYF